jgi:hypothetical protein
MKFPKMSLWVVVSGIVVWAVFGSALVLGPAVYRLVNPPVQYDELGWEQDRSRVPMPMDEGDRCERWDAPGWCPIRNAAMMIGTAFLISLLMPLVAIIELSRGSGFELLFALLMVVLITPYVAIPLYWFILHQIDKALKRRREAKPLTI